MTTSQTSFLSEILNDEPIPAGKRAYFQERLRNRVYDLVISEFMQKCENEKLTQKHLADRIGKGTDQLSRWFSSPGNWTLDTVSDLLLGIASAELEIGVTPLAGAPKRNSHKPEWLTTNHEATNPIVTMRCFSVVGNSDAGTTVLNNNRPVSKIIQTITPATAAIVGASE